MTVIRLSGFGKEKLEAQIGFMCHIEAVDHMAFIVVNPYSRRTLKSLDPFFFCRGLECQTQNANC